MTPAQFDVLVRRLIAFGAPKASHQDTLKFFADGDFKRLHSRVAVLSSNMKIDVYIRTISRMHDFCQPARIPRLW